MCSILHNSQFFIKFLTWCFSLQGAMSGLITGLIITLWIGFGRPKPPPPFKPVSVEGCPAMNASLVLPENLSIETSKIIGNKTLIKSLIDVSTNLSDPIVWDTTAVPSTLDEGDLTTLPSVDSVTGVSSGER